MDLVIYAHHMEMTQRLRNYVEKKTSKLDRFMPNLAQVRVDLSAQKAQNAGDRQVAQITVRDERGTILRAEERNSDIFAAIDAVIDKLYRQIDRYRGKRRGRRRQAAANSMAEMIDVLEDEDEDSEGYVIARRKRFAMMPMSSDEAVEQMELLGHDFYVFLNADEQAINVVYRRRDATYGLLQPELV